MAPLPLQYFGLPPCGSKPTKSDWMALLQKVETRLAIWVKKNLYFGGRLALINMVLMALPVYFMPIFKLPWVSKRIDKYQKSFFWKGDMSATGVSCKVN